MSDRVKLHHGSCLDVLRDLPDCSVDAVVTDPPYGLANTTPEKITETVIRWANGERDYLPEGKGFMGNPWDSFVPPAAVWDDCLRVLKPGGHVLAFAGSRTIDLMTLGLRLAGFDIRDSIAWLYGSGFPKSLDVSKAIDRLRIEDREPMLRVRAWFNARRLERGMSLGQINALFGLATNGGGNASNWTTHPTNIEIPSWDKWLVLKDALELSDDMDAEVWRLNGRKGKPGDNFEAREVLSTRQVADIRNGHGREYGGAMFAGEETGKIEHKTTAPATPAAERWQGWGTALKPAHEPIVVARKPLEGTVADNVLTHGTGAINIDGCRTVGRWPANVALDETQAHALDQQSGILKTGAHLTHHVFKASENNSMSGGNQEKSPRRNTPADSGGASRFFYVAKAGKSERPNVEGVAHPTVKPLTLMRWLCRLVTPPGGTILEPFAGSGTTIEAALLEGFNVIGIEREAEYLPLIEARIARALATDTDLFGGAA